MNELRRRQVVLAAALLGAAPLSATPQPGKVYRLGVLVTFLPVGGLRATLGWPAFLDRLRDYGFVENENLHIEVRSYEGNRERLSELAGELARLNLDVVTAIMNPRCSRCSARCVRRRS